MPQIVKKSVPEKKLTQAERLNKVNPISKAKYEAAMQKQWKSRPENQMKSAPEKSANPGQRFKPSSNQNEVRMAQNASSMPVKTPYKMPKTQSTPVRPKKNK
jgi:hypothetical protein